MPTTQTIFPFPTPFTDNNGAPLNGGTLTFYQAGTTTLQNTYSDQALTVLNPNPISLNSAGFPVVSGVEVKVYPLSAAYKVVVKDSGGTTLHTWDNIEPTAPWNYQPFTLPITVAQGGTGDVTLAAHGVLIGEGTSAVAVTTPGTTGQVFASNGASADPTFQAASAVGASMILLKAGSGTSTATGATDVDTYALASQLTAKDTLVVYWTIEQTAQTVTTPRVRNVTDSVQILDLSEGVNFAAGHSVSGVTTMRQGQTAATVVLAQQSAFDGSGSGNYAYGNKATFATPWTGAWTLGFGFASQTSGGTFAYSYALYRLTGQ